MNEPSQFFRENGYCSIDLYPCLPDLLKGCAEACKDIEEQDWTYIIRNSSEEVDLPYTVAPSRLKHVKADALKVYHEGGFAFSFRRVTELAGSSPHPAMGLFDDYLMREDFLELLSSISRRKIGAMETRYINRFDHGDFLTTHCDPGSNLGIALNLTPKWNLNYGGLTFILDEKRSSILDTLAPAFGRLFLFDTSQRKVPHFVSMVTSPPTQNRIALIARYG